MINSKGRILFRADGSTEMGLGHMVRTGALASMLNHDWDCELYTRCTVPSILAEAKAIFSKLVQLPGSADPISEAAAIGSQTNKNDIIVLDGYEFGKEYQQAITINHASLVSVDDIQANYFLADIIINSAGGITPLDYEATAGTQFYLGPRYTMLREAFLKRARSSTVVNANKDILVCLGGADPNNVTLDVVKYIHKLDRFDTLRIVTGGAYQHLESLQAYVSVNELNAIIYHQVDAEELAALMASCSYAVCSPSTVSYEYMTIGGTLFLKQIADNQKHMISFLVKEGYAFLLDDVASMTEPRQLESLEKQKQVFDGKAGERLKAIFEKLFLAGKISCRRATREDMLICYDWANDPGVREQSYNGNPIKLPDHEAWFASRLEDENCFFYILELEGKPFAQVRFQVDNGKAVLGYLAASEYRSKGLGTAILSKGIQAFSNDYKSKIEIIGFVKFSNIASQRSFERLRFYRQEAREYDASYKYTMYYEGLSDR